MKTSFSHLTLRKLLIKTLFWLQILFYLAIVIAVIGFVIYELSKPCDDDCIDYLEDSREDSYRL